MSTQHASSASAHPTPVIALHCSGAGAGQWRQPAACEFAIAVTGRWCGIRLGCMLLERLVDRTVRSCIPRMSADTVAIDKPMPPLAGRAGFARARKREDGRLVHLVKELPAPDRSASRPMPAETAGTA